MAREALHYARHSVTVRYRSVRLREEVRPCHSRITVDRFGSQTRGSAAACALATAPASMGGRLQPLA
jgi:hypothetical protein